MATENSSQNVLALLLQTTAKHAGAANAHKAQAAAQILSMLREAQAGAQAVRAEILALRLTQVGVARETLGLRKSTVTC